MEFYVLRTAVLNRWVKDVSDRSFKVPPKLVPNDIQLSLLQSIEYLVFPTEFLRKIQAHSTSGRRIGPNLEDNEQHITLTLEDLSSSPFLCPTKIPWVIHGQLPFGASGGAML